MKEIVKTSRLAGSLEKLYGKLNADFFNSELERPVITIQSSSRSYGHYTLYDAWSVKGDGHKEINIAAGTLDRPIEEIIVTLLHEMCHQYNNEILNVQDCSNRGVYHNKLFRKTAEAVGLIVTRSEKYGWSCTAPSDDLLTWILENSIAEIQMNRNDYDGLRIVGGNNAANGGVTTVGITKASSTRKLICPCCGQSVRATKAINILCGDCMVRMIET